MCAIAASMPSTTFAAMIASRYSAGQSTSLAAFETALAEAQKQERYFATFIAPMRPEIALYPKRLLDTFIAVLVLCAVWMISQFLYRSFRDHAI